MSIPLSAVCDGQWIDLRGDQYADRDGTDPLLADPKYVYVIHSGAPTADDKSKVSSIKYLGQPVDAEDGITIIVSPNDGARAMLLYFPNDQHEVRIAQDPDEDW